MLEESFPYVRVGPMWAASDCTEQHGTVIMHLIYIVEVFGSNLGQKTEIFVFRLNSNLILPEFAEFHTRHFPRNKFINKLLKPSFNGVK
jgi:hypothetical protein